MRGLLLPSLALLVGCAQTGDAGGPSTSPPGVPPGPQVAVSTSDATGLKVSATWAAYAGDDDVWRVLSPISAGTYAVPSSARWSVALACATEDAESVEVSIYRRTSATTTLDVTLASFCTPAGPPEEGVLHGTLTNLPPSTTWLDFGYARDWRGTALPVTGTSASYEIVNLAPGPWDLAFGIRDDASTAFTRMVIRRAEILAVDKTIDLDVAGPGSFVPEKRKLAVHGVRDADTTKFAIYYSMGGAYGVDVAPQDVPFGPDIATEYATVPAASQASGDRYRGNLLVVVDPDRPSESRTIAFAFHDAIDVDVTLGPPLAAPDVVREPGGHFRASTRVAPHPGAASYEVLAVAQAAKRTTHEWRTSIDAAAAGAELRETTPDLSALAGWNAAWGIRTDVPVKVDVSAASGKTGLGDGTVEHTSMKSVLVMP